MRNISLKLKFLLSVVVATLLGVMALGGVLAFILNQDAGQYVGIARQEARNQLEHELQVRADARAQHVAAVVGASVVANDVAALNRVILPFQDDVTLVQLSVLDMTNLPLYEWHRGIAADSDAGTTAARESDPAKQPTRQATVPIRVMAESLPGATTPRTVGTASVTLSASSDGAPEALLTRMTSAARQQFRRGALWLISVSALAFLLFGSFAWWAGRRLGKPLDLLTRGAERFGQGDYSRPVDVGRNDELGDLQMALERMRQKLRNSTISKNYLNSVLGSMTDAVFCSSPDGVIKLANSAACKLLGYGEEELIGRSIAAILDESERAGFDLQQAANETRESLVRTRQGQTIPVALTGSQITSDDPQFQGSIFVARNITERKRAERRIRYLARYDALTKIPNRMQFQHLLQQGIARSNRSNTAVALLYLDMDHFKEVNDTFGHASGDRTLEILSERLTRAVPKEAVVGRLAGDEFAVFIDGLPADADNRGPIAHLARTILTEVSKAFQLNQQEVFLTCSIGIGFCPRDAENVIDLIRNADAAMYYSKQNGGNTFAFYSPEMNAAAVERLMMKSKLRRALERDELVVRYQPKVDIRTGKIVGAEALLRWRLPGHGDIPPSQFIPLAEETNLILDMGEWVLNRVCLDYRNFLADVRAPGRISLNLSLKQLRQASFILRCRSVFRRHSVSPTAFELEITETTLMVDAKRTLRLLDELYAMGLHLSIDDFGTGYSSLSALQQFPIGTLKIDQSFVRNLAEDENDATIVRTIIEMGRSLKMEVVAEGVESAKQVAFLNQHHCYLAQGRLFGEPCTADELQALMRQQETGHSPFLGVLPNMSGDASGAHASLTA